MTDVCKICNKDFTYRGLHTHIPKAHDLSLPEYYETYEPRKDRLTGDKILYTEYFSYINAEFLSSKNEKDWLKQANVEDAREYLAKVLKRRMELKNIKYGPSLVEFNTSEMPPYKAYVHFFGSYTKACEEIGVEPLLYDIKEIPSLQPKQVEILVDSREQRPLDFKHQKNQKLIFGDYTLGGDDYTYTYVDRKSDSDFKSTVTGGQERFIREIQRAVDMDSYLYIVVEDSINEIELHNSMSPHKSNMNYVWSSMRKIQHLYPRKCQFVFTGSRENSQRIIPYLLRYGKDLWDKDVQYLLEVKGATKY